MASLVEVRTVIHLCSWLHLQLFKLIGENFNFCLLVFFLIVELVGNCFSALFNRNLLCLVAFLIALCRLLLAGSTSRGLLIYNLLADDHSLLKCFNSLSVLRFFSLRLWCLIFWSLSLDTCWRTLSLRKVGKRLVLKSTSVACCHVCYAYATTRCLFKGMLLCSRLMSQGQVGSSWGRNMASGWLQLRTLQHLVNSVILLKL